MNGDDLIIYSDHALKGGATSVKQIHPSSVVTAPWVRLKCQFGCGGYNYGYCCPPHTPTAEETRRVLD
jgi:predicted metal-binding protein